MASQPRSLGPWAILPGQVVVMFPSRYASDAAHTLGYYGSIVRLDRESAERHYQRDRWKYVVHIPALRGDYLIRARDMLLTTEFLPPAEQVGPGCAIRFDRELRRDYPAIHGHYRLGDGPTWHRFHFTRRRIPWPQYELFLRLRDGAGVFTLRYFLPQSDLLDRHVVLRALTEICGVKVFSH